jgi:hypothetical protein
VSRRGSIALSVAILVLGVACIDLSVNPSEIASIEFPPLPNTSIPFTDTLRDTSGKLFPLVARVFDASGKEVTTAQPTFIAVDTLGLVTIATANGKSLVVAKGVAGTARLVASIGTLQSVSQPVDIVPAPDTVLRTGVASDTIAFHDPATAADTSAALALRVQSKGAGVKSLLVNYSVKYKNATIPIANDTTQQFSLIDGSGRGSSVDTTDASGNVARQLRYRAPTGQGKQDTVIVTASVRGFLGVAVGGSPVQFLVVLKPSP